MSDLHDTAKTKRTRVFLCFVLFALIVLFGSSLVAKTALISPSFIEDKLTSYEYVSAYRDDVLDFANDVFVQNGIPTDNLEEVITLDTAQEIADAYINSLVKAKTGYTTQTVAEDISQLTSDLTDEIKAQIANTNYKYNAETAQKLAEKISTYANEQITIPGASYMETITNVGSLASVVLMVISAVFAVLVALILYFVGAKSKRYRGVRGIAISFMSAGFYGLLLSLIIIIISKVKSIDIYPVYIKDALMSYIYGSVGMIAVYSAVFLLVSLVLCTAVWKIKRNQK